MHDFHQEVTFKQYFYLHQQLQFMFLFANCLSLCLIFLCVCLDYSRSNEQIFIKNWWIGPGQRKNLLKEGSGSSFGYKKKIMNFQRSHFNVFLMTLAFYLIFL